MGRPSKGQRLCVYISESDRFHHQPLADALIDTARREGIAGATALRGIEGFGASRRLGTARILSASDRLPVVVVFIDEQPNIERFIPIAADMIGDGLMTVETVDFPAGRSAGHGRRTMPGDLQ